LHARPETIAKYRGRASSRLAGPWRHALPQFRLGTRCRQTAGTSGTPRWRFMPLRWKKWTAVLAKCWPR
jgi:hypothetical protein